MKVILKRDVKGLGREGDLREVKDGYARNHLIPTGAAVLADLGAVRNWERHRDQRDDRDRSIRADAEATAERIGSLSLKIGVKAGERDRLFGSVTTRDIADRLRQEGIEIDRHDIHLREPIKTVGEHEVRVHVLAGVEAQLKVEVVAEH
jgi:large subunit ribosomal protein L9